MQKLQNEQKLDVRQLINEPISSIGVWIIQRDGHVVFVTRDMYEWMRRFK